MALFSGTLCPGSSGTTSHRVLPPPTYSLQPQTDKIHKYCKQLTRALDPSCPSDVPLAESVNELRSQHLEKFRELVRVHLSFIIDLPHFDEDSFISLAKQPKRRFLQLPPPLMASKRKALRGKVCHKHGNISEAVSNRIEALIAYLLDDSRFAVEGIFRKTGNCSRQKQLRRLLLCSEVIDLDQFTVHDIANVFKTIIRDLEEPLLSERLCGVLMAIAELNSPRCNDRGEVCERSAADKQLVRSRQLKALRLLTLLIPPKNLSLLTKILFFLHTVATSLSTKMTFTTLGMIFGPVLFCPPSLETFQKKIESLNEISSFLIKFCHQITEIPRSFAEDVRKNLEKQNAVRDVSVESLLVSTPSTPMTEPYISHGSAGLSGTDDSLDTNVCFSERKATTCSDYSEKQVAALCAHIRKLPDTKEKRRLEKRFGFHSAVPEPTWRRRHFCASFRKRHHRCGHSSSSGLMGFNDPIPSETPIREDTGSRTPLSRFFNTDRRLMRALSSIRIYKMHVRAPPAECKLKTKLDFDIPEVPSPPAPKRRCLGQPSKSLPRLCISSPKLLFSDSAQSSSPSPNSSTSSRLSSCSTIFESPIYPFKETAL